ncbi:MAG: glycyl-radical enzyme activating protein [Eubacteriales bacterium]
MQNIDFITPPLRADIFNIQHFSIHDGPGVRTVVFFKGCNLRCLWCHNPESVSRAPQLYYYGSKCIGCGKCVALCPQGAHCFDSDGTHHFDRTKCTECLSCVETCYAEALVGVGESVDVEHVMKSVRKEKPYFADTGGVTFSGGECMLQIDFLKELSKKCRAEGIRTAVDTAGNVPWSSFEKILPLTDLFLYDIKAADTSVHRALTGADNTLILSNLKKLSDSGARIWIRIPYIKECNGQQMEGIADIIGGIKAERVELLPYHRLGGSKHASLGMSEAPEYNVPDREDMKAVSEIFALKGIEIKY